MKYTWLALLALVAATSGASFFPEDDDDESIYLARNVIDNLIKQALEYVRKALKEKDPFPLPNVPQQHIVDKGVDLTVSLKNFKASKASDFTVDNVQSNLPSLTVKFAGKLPALHLEGEYEVLGVVEGLKVEGKGPLKLDVDQFALEGMLGEKVVKHELQVAKLEFSYDIKGLAIDMPDLKVGDMSQEEVHDLVNGQFLQFLQNNKQDVSTAVASRLRTFLDSVTKGKSLKDLMDWVKNAIKPTA